MPELPKRKNHRLENHDYAEDGFYFLTICTKGKAHILSEIVLGPDGAAAVRLKPYGQAAESRILSIPGIDKYVVMPNHVHMIVCKSNGKSIASDIRTFKGLVSKQVGASIWQDSFYDHIIRNEQDYQEKWCYIDENPAKWLDDEYNT